MAIRLRPDAPRAAPRPARPTLLLVLVLVLVLVQLLGLVTALGAMVAPAPGAVMADWSGRTIYPWWTVVLIGTGVVLAASSLRSSLSLSFSPAVGRGGWPASAPAATVVVAAQVAALGIWAHEHWLPAFGMGGGYSGEVDDLEKLAVVVAVGGIASSVAALVQLLSHQRWPAATAPAVRRRRVTAGGAVLLGIPLLSAVVGPDLRDGTSVGALTLVFGVPWGLSLLAAGWLRHGAPGVIGAGLTGAVLAGLTSRDQLTGGDAGGVLLAAAALLTWLLVVEARTRTGRDRS